MKTYTTDAIQGNIFSRSSTWMGRRDRVRREDYQPARRVAWNQASMHSELKATSKFGPKLPFSLSRIENLFRYSLLLGCLRKHSALPTRLRFA